MDKISIIIPVYNVEKYISKCLDSVINQTYQNLEIIIIDDGSPDKSYKICKNYLQKDSRLKLIRQKNKGLSGARNTGLENSTGKYVFFLDSDDYINSETIEILYKNAIFYNSDIVMCSSRIIDEDSNKLIQKDSLLNDYNQDIHKIMKNIILPLKTAAWGKLIKRSLIGNERFLEGHIHGEDLEFLLRILKKDTTFSTIDYLGYNYLKRKQSITTSNFSEHSFDEVFFKDKANKIIINKFPQYSYYSQIWRFRARMNLIRKIYKNNLNMKYQSVIKEYRSFCLQQYEYIKKYLNIKEKIEFFIFVKLNFCYKTILRTLNI
ncbi:glycosyltransferase family 2 protein [Thomasclavelia spiroformis]|uniref:glycosyltransferase family 2 protein n=1 Tax=Thomasclavelia spiroformis TaxID=29348 RepID=UPI00241E0D37|nr:glycosyltransferase family 2 protein [Thomasclavelia spiroformis]MBS6685932.1 glycosyltransferase family 2 protein [Thomasclavelia spiroformis]